MAFLRGTVCGRRVHGHGGVRLIFPRLFPRSYTFLKSATMLSVTCCRKSASVLDRRGVLDGWMGHGLVLHLREWHFGIVLLETRSGQRLPVNRFDALLGSWGWIRLS